MNQYNLTFISNLPSLITVLAICFILGACTTLDSKNNWPTDVPDRQIFVNAYKLQSGLPDSRAKLEAHLNWVKRFYQGTLIYPIGWNRMTEMLLSSLDGQPTYADAKRRIGELGERICIEWAQDNRIAKIRTANIIVWGNALRTAVSDKQQIWFLEQVEKDVEELIAGRLLSRDINRSRYYPEEDFDDF